VSLLYIWMPSSHPETFSRFMTAPWPAGSTAREQPPPLPVIVVSSTVRSEPETKPHEGGLATRSVCRVTGPPWGTGC
jgi:hypothetical protein